MLPARVADVLHLHSTPRSLVDGASSSSSSDDSPIQQNDAQESQDLQEARQPYIHAMLAGGFGGLSGDMLMHSLDTVKTRQQGDPHRPPKYINLRPSYATIFRQEGILRGLYGGVTPAALGSFVGTSVFFGGYEWSKRWMIDVGIAPSIAYFSAGLVADIIAAPLYVPSEVLKTRLQLQGRYNNPHFHSGYNYRSTLDAVRTIIRHEGVPALYHGFRATLYRDLPFSALQFAFYEKERELAKWWVGSKHIGIPLELLTGATAGGMAGTITCPLDVVKTRIQTQILQPTRSIPSSTSPSPPEQPSRSTPSQLKPKPKPSATKEATHPPRRPISTSSATSSILKTKTVTLDTESVLEGLKIIYRTEGLAGWFRGVGPRAIWTSVQSGAMFLLYQSILKWFADHPV